MVLRFAFAGAVTGAGTVAHYHYGTKEDVHATVLSVQPVDYFDHGAGMIITTDRGTFSNTASAFLHGKDDGDVSSYYTHLQPGAEVVMTVYGYDSYGPRNISGLKVIDGARDTWYGFNVAAADTALIRMTQPLLYRDMMALSRLPLSGKPIFDLIINPAYGINAETQKSDNDNRLGAYFPRERTLFIEEGEGAEVTFHEYFHAAQEVDRTGGSYYELALKDAFFCGMLQEACAMAYEFVCQREAENKGIYLRGIKQNGPVTQKLNGIFDRSYKLGWQACTSADPTVREKEALAAGGQAIVRFLMEGGLAGWTMSYRDQVSKNVNSNIRFSSTSPTYLRSDVYAEKRHRLFSKMGRISDDFSLVPAEYMGPEMERFVDMVLKAAKMEITEQSAPTSPWRRPSPYTM